MTNLPDPTDYAIVAEVLQERHRQQTRWGEQDHTFAEWMVILGEEYGEVCREIWELTLSPPPHRSSTDLELIANYRAELIQVAAVAVAAIRNLDRKI